MLTHAYMCGRMHACTLSHMNIFTGSESQLWGKTGCCVFSVHVPCLCSFWTISEQPSFVCLINALVLAPPAECKRYSLISRLNLCKIAQLKAYLNFIAKQLAKENEWCILLQFTQMNRVVLALFHQRDYLSSLTCVTEPLKMYTMF